MTIGLRDEPEACDCCDEDERLLDLCPCDGVDSSERFPKAADTAPWTGPFTAAALFDEKLSNATHISSSVAYGETAFAKLPGKQLVIMLGN